MKQLACPFCKSKNVIPVIYGLPYFTVMNKAEAGKIKLGGCKVQKENWWCKDCQKYFYKEVNK